MNEQERQILLRFLEEKQQELEAFVEEMGFDKTKAQKIYDNLEFGWCMSDLDKQLLVEFLTDNFELFQVFLSTKEIEESEADSIIDQIHCC